MLIGLGIALVMVMLSLPITLYMAFERDNSLKPASLGVFAMWICLIATGMVGGYLWPKILGSVERKWPEDPKSTIDSESKNSYHDQGEEAQDN